MNHAWQLPGDDRESCPRPAFLREAMQRPAIRVGLPFLLLPKHPWKREGERGKINKGKVQLLGGLALSPPLPPQAHTHHRPALLAPVGVSLPSIQPWCLGGAWPLVWLVRCRTCGRLGGCSDGLGGYEGFSTDILHCQHALHQPWTASMHMQMHQKPVKITFEG